MDLNDATKREIAAMNETLSLGDVVVFVSGDHAGRKGRFLGFGRDSGYRVPFIAVGDEAMAMSVDDLSAERSKIAAGFSTGLAVYKPWQNEIVSLDLMAERRRSLLNQVEIFDKIEAFAHEAEQAAAPSLRM